MADRLLDPSPANGGAKQKQFEDPYGDYRQRPVTPADKSPRGFSPGGRSPSARSPRATSPFSTAMGMPRDTGRTPRKLILCFDGTGNKFHGDESDSNILKIFRMLDRSAGDQYHYYQPGIGTYVISDSLSHSGVRARIKSWYQKAKDSAIGSSFDQHVVGGYRFLMRFYQRGDEIYMFGFSRGAYIARFLAEMLDYIGLLCHGNEEMVKFAWKAFAQWQARKPPSKEVDDDGEESEEDQQTRKMYNYMKGFRETFSRPVGRIRFLGLFDTVNSVPRFETAWMQRSKFPYTARSSARYIRHAVSIDERRAKFRQDLLYQKAPKHKHHHTHRHHVAEVIDRIRRSVDVPHTNPGETQNLPPVPTEKEKHPSQFLTPGDAGRGRRGAVSHKHHYAPYRARSSSRQRRSLGALFDEQDNLSCSDASQWEAEMDDWKNEDQDIDEVWFAGGHGDIGGGWEALDDRKSASHVPLTWMVREAMKAGLSFDMENVVEMGCQDVFDSVRLSSRGVKSSRVGRPAIRVQDEAGHVQGEQNGESSLEIGPRDFAGEPAPDASLMSPFHELMHRAHTSLIHDSLEYGGGLAPMAVSAWKFMEYLPFRRMDLQPDGSWKPIRWPLPCGEVRDIPDNVRVHGSVIRRLKEDETYRPGNLIIGGGGRGVRRAPAEYGIGDWICVAEHGDPIGEIWEKKPREANGNGTNGTNDSPARVASVDMPIPFLMYVIGHGPPDWLRDNAYTILSVAMTMTLLYFLKKWTSGKLNPSEKNLHGRVVMFTGGTSGIGALAAQEMARQGAQIILLTHTSPSDPFLVEYIQDMRDGTNNQLIYAEQVDLSSLHSIRKFATKWIDNAPPRRLDMIVLCAATMTPPGGERMETKEGIEETWMVNYLANFHLLGILSPAIKAQPFDRDVRIIMATCSSYIGSPPLKEPIVDRNWSPSRAYARSKLALTVFGQAFQKHLDTYKRPDQLPMNAKVIFVDPGLSRTPGTRRWLTRGSLFGLAIYVVGYAFPWLLLKSPFRGAQSILYAAMESRLAVGHGGRLIKECMEVDFARSDVRDDEVAKQLWEESDALIERTEKASAKARAADKAAEDRKEEKGKEQEQIEEIKELVETIQKGKQKKQKQRKNDKEKRKAKSDKTNV
ncbi:hypothetical protein ED733_001321 [Metarhizium rileyi]|uniref:T6SS Phospholipase effector Tle1-like catalytic domain-containing protein n=1 Tax=Metarhizium rileyi (strain RCEF 4871) TaxID=1649241 RepID=A0A5C6G4E4_METRR|nr:hypothetical protein ED733_001321 [Metarhizium rileyi]